MCPELHLLIGLVNHVFWKGIVEVLGREKTLMWPKKFKLIPQNYQGEHFEGNACRKLLTKADSLFDPEFWQNVTEKLRILPFVNTIKVMNKIVESCFSVNEVKPDLDAQIHELKKCFEATELSKTLEMHIILQHLRHCLNYLQKKVLVYGPNRLERLFIASFSNTGNVIISNY